VHASIAEGLAAPGGTRSALAARVPALVLGTVLTLAAILLYVLSNPQRFNFYDHFVWQADAYLHGRVWIPYPIVGQNDWFQDVYPISTTAALLPFPPLPALVLLPAVVFYGLDTDQELIAAILAGVGVGLTFWMLGRLPIRLLVRIATTVFFAVGTVFWWTATAGTTWYFAHVVAVDLMLIAIGLALRGDPRAALDGDDPRPTPAVGGEPDRAGRWRRPHPVRWFRRQVDATLPLDGRQLVIGLLLGLAATARLPVALGGPFFVLVGPGGTWQRRGLSAALGASLPVLALFLYNVGTTGHVFHPGYEWQYQREQGYTALGYHADWSIEDVRYIPQNVGIALGSVPYVLPSARTYALGADFQPDEPLCTDPGATRSLFDIKCPLALPHDIGTSLLFSSPAYLLLIPALRRSARTRLVAGAVLAIVLIGLLNLAHFSQGWVQWGYRFSNDLVPFALPLVALGASGRDGRLRLAAYVLIALSVAINAWGVIWGNILGW
jgi:hypothetical protein